MSASKFFTPPLTPADREQIFRSLGFERFHYAYRELCGGHDLRTVVVAGGERRMTLEKPTGIPTIGYRHVGQHLSVHAPQEPASLWEELFPYPFSMLGRWFREDMPDGLAVDPPSLVPPLYELWRTLEALDEAMKETEITCLWLCRRSPGQVEELPLLCHYVRRRRIRLGNGWAWFPGGSGASARVVGLGELHRRGELTADTLRERFGGTRAAFLYLDTSAFLTERPLVAEVTESLRALLARFPEGPAKAPAAPPSAEEADSARLSPPSPAPDAPSLKL